MERTIRQILFNVGHVRDYKRHPYNSLGVVILLSNHRKGFAPMFISLPSLSPLPDTKPKKPCVVALTGLLGKL